MKWWPFGKASDPIAFAVAQADAAAMFKAAGYSGECTAWMLKWAQEAARQGGWRQVEIDDRYRFLKFESSEAAKDWVKDRFREVRIDPLSIDFSRKD